MNDVFRTALCPRPSRGNDPNSIAVASVKTWLESRQNRDGSWGTGLLLDKLISTCHAAMFLLTAGSSAESSAIRSASKWLSTPEVLAHNSSFWVIGPLGSLKDDASIKTVKEQFDKLRDYINSDAEINPEQYFEAFFLRASLATGVTQDQSFLEMCVADLKKDWNRKSGWSNMASTTTNCYVALCQFDTAFAKKIRSDVIALVNSWSSGHDNERISWGTPIHTAYTVMNLVESDLLTDPTLQLNFRKAINWLQSIGSDNTWSSDPPYGGRGDIVSIDYPTAAVARAIVAAMVYDDPGGARAAISSSHIRLIQLSLRLWKIWSSLTTFGILALLVTLTYQNWSAHILPFVAWVMENWNWSWVVPFALAVLFWLLPEHGKKLRASIWKGVKKLFGG